MFLKVPDKRVLLPFTSCRKTIITKAAATTIQERKHLLATGSKLELLVQEAMGQSKSEHPILFVHGSYHSAWCWKENFMPYFAEKGYTSYAVSMRGQGYSDGVQGSVAGTLDVHVQDIADVIKSLPGSPILVSHSFGGLVVQKYVLGLASPAPLPPLAGVAFLASVPPSGNKALVGRIVRKDWALSARITWGFITKSFVRSADACRELFFSKDIPHEDLSRYQAQLATCSSVRLIDLADVNVQVPFPPPPTNCPPAFVLGGTDDAIVDLEAVEELARYYGVQPIILPDLAHDVMLDTRWKAVAAALEKWLSTI